MEYVKTTTEQIVDGPTDDKMPNSRQGTQVTYVPAESPYDAAIDLVRAPETWNGKILAVSQIMTGLSLVLHDWLTEVKEEAKDPAIDLPPCVIAGTEALLLSVQAAGWVAESLRYQVPEI